MDGTLYDFLCLKRRIFINEYISAYYSEPIRTSTIMYDLVGLLSYFIENKALFGSYLTSDDVRYFEKIGVRYFIDLTWELYKIPSDLENWSNPEIWLLWIPE